METISKQFVIVMTASIILMGVSTVLMVRIPQVAYAQESQGNQSSSDANCAPDQLPASINGEIQCMRQGECYSEEFDGNEVKHCNFMMSNQ
jgi:hypothetical protein